MVHSQALSINGILDIRENKAHLRVSNLRGKQKKWTGGGGYQSRTNKNNRRGGRYKFCLCCDNVKIGFLQEQKADREKEMKNRDR